MVSGSTAGRAVAARQAAPQARASAVTLNKQISDFFMGWFLLLSRQVAFPI